MSQPAGVKARVYIPAGCPIRNMAKKNAGKNLKKKAEKAGESLPALAADRGFCRANKNG